MTREIDDEDFSPPSQDRLADIEAWAGVELKEAVHKAVAIMMEWANKTPEGWSKTIPTFSEAEEHMETAFTDYAHSAISRCRDVYPDTLPIWKSESLLKWQQQFEAERVKREAEVVKAPRVAVRDAKGQIVAAIPVKSLSDLILEAHKPRDISIDAAFPVKPSADLVDSALRMMNTETALQLTRGGDHAEA